MNLTFDHLALHVSDVGKSLTFYAETLGLPILPRPEFSFNGAWLQLDEGLQLHLIEGRESTAQSGSRSNHFAFVVEDANALEEKLRAQGVEIVVNKIRVDSVRQLFVKDPDGYYIEFNEGIPKN